MFKALAAVATLAYAAEVETMTPAQTTFTTTSDDPTCWKKAYGRGVGKAISSCDRWGDDYPDKDGALCYPNCRDGYNGVGPVCWQNCPDGWRNDGCYCAKPSSYGRGAGYTSESKCEKHMDKWDATSCEKNGLLWYPTCRDSFHNVACCVCSPDCPDGMNDIGVSCHKDSYGRTAGKVLGCTNEQEYDAGLCYTPCDYGCDGVGPVCWGSCPAGTSSCGGMLCLEDSETCTSHIADQVEDGFKLVVDIAKTATVPGYVIDIASIMSDFTYPDCEDY